MREIGHTANVSEFDPWRGRQKSLSVRCVEKYIMDSVGHVIIQRFTERKVEMYGETRRVRRKPRERKTSSKKGQRLNEITEPPEKQVDTSIMGTLVRPIMEC